METLCQRDCRRIAIEEQWVGCAQQAPDVIGIGRLAFDQARQIAGDRGVLLPDEYDAAAQTSPQADDAAIFKYAHRPPKQGAARIMLLPPFLPRPYAAAGFNIRNSQQTSNTAWRDR